jgi:hypothetical protein
MTNKFKSKFLELLKEAPELDFDPSMERDAAENTISDADVGIDDYDIDMEPEEGSFDDIDDAMARQNEQMGGILDEWSRNIDKFVNYINGEQNNSIRIVLKNANPQSILGDLQKHQDRITKIASELAGLKQSFIGAKSTK